MAGFVASTAVEQLTYDFNPYVAISGEVPEPSGDAITAYRKAIVEVYQTSGIGDYASASSLTDLDMAKFDEILAASDAVVVAAIQATADITGIAASAINQLPGRIQQAFLGYVMGVFLNPEA